jgi:hypothetical protein
VNLVAYGSFVKLRLHNGWVGVVGSPWRPQPEDLLAGGSSAASLQHGGWVHVGSGASLGPLRASEHRGDLVAYASFVKPHLQNEWVAAGSS